MKFETIEGANPIDGMTVVGTPADRIAGPLKTTGRARYAYDQHDVAPNQAYGEIVGAAIAKGRSTKIDIAKAEAAPGVLTVVAASNAGKFDKGEFYVARQLAGP